jgi:hypothetical protein
MDDTLDIGTILTLVNEFKNFNPDSLWSQQIPTFADPRGGVAYQGVDWDAAEPLLEQFRGVDPGVPLSSGSVIVDVTGDDDDVARLDEVSGQLDAAGYDAEVAEGSSSDTTTIFYGPKGRDAALLLATQLESVPRFELDEEISGYRVVLAVGDDFAGVRAAALPLDQLPADLIPATTETTAPSTTAGTPADGVVDPTLGAEPATTTTMPGVVPTDPAKAATCR